MRCAVTGAGGFIGWNLVHFLRGKDHEVLSIDITHLPSQDITACDLDLAFRKVDTVFHMAAISSLPECQSDPYKAFQVNVGGTARVLEAARWCNVRKVVFASTAAVYENSPGSIYNEEKACEPDLIYAQTKLAAEELCLSYVRNYRMDITILRYFNVYGPGQNITRKSPPFTAYVIKELQAGRSPILHSNGLQRRDYVYVDDVNELNYICATHKDARGEIFNVSSGSDYSVRELYDLIAGALDREDIKATYAPAQDFWKAYPRLVGLEPSRLMQEVNKRCMGSTYKAKELLGWQAHTSIKDGIRKTVESYK